MSFRIVLLLAAAGASAGAQKPPAVRALGAIERTSTDSLASAAAALPMSGGRVLVNDITGHRLLLFDSTLAKPIVVADTTSATGTAYGAREGTLIRYRGDTALFIDPSSLSMLMIGPSGKIERVMAIPRPREAQYLIGSIFGTPGFDARGRLVHYGRAEFGGGTFILCCVGRIKVGAPPVPRAVILIDSSLIVRVDLETRLVDTVGGFRIPRVKTTFNTDEQGFVQSISTTYDALPVVDAWAVSPDGAIAIVRGRDYHVDWILSDGKRESSPKLPFDWQRLSDERKQALLDSTAAWYEAEREAMAVQLGARTPGAAGGGRGGGTPPPAPSGPPPTTGTSGGRIPNVVGKGTLADLPDYAPAFTAGGAWFDTVGNLWIRTTTMVKGQPVYDIVNRSGEIVDRVQLPPFRTIAGFAPGVVFMAVKDAAGFVHLERARVR